MTNLKLIISTRTQEEFDRVLQWAEENDMVWSGCLEIPTTHKAYWSEHLEDTAISVFQGGLAFSPISYYEGLETYAAYTFLSFPEFEKQYLISKQ